MDLEPGAFVCDVGQYHIQYLVFSIILKQPKVKLGEMEYRDMAFVLRVYFALMVFTG